jgi:hypothetical protein
LVLLDHSLQNSVLKWLKIFESKTEPTNPSADFCGTTTEIARILIGRRPDAPVKFKKQRAHSRLPCGEAGSEIGGKLDRKRMLTMLSCNLAVIVEAKRKRLFEEERLLGV